MILELSVTFWLASMGHRHVLADPPALAQGAVAIGLSPEALAAANFSVEQTQAVLGRLAAARELSGTLARARFEASEAADRLTVCMERLRDDPGSHELAAELAQSSAALDSANAAIVATEGLLVQEVLRDVQPDAATLIELFRSGASRGLPGEMRLAGLSEQDLAVFEAALVAERRAVRLDTEMSVEHANMLNGVRGRTDVIQARQRLGMLVPQLSVVFEQAEPPR